MYQNAATSCCRSAHEHATSENVCNVFASGGHVQPSASCHRKTPTHPTAATGYSAKRRSERLQQWSLCRNRKRRTLCLFAVARVVLCAGDVNDAGGHDALCVCSVLWEIFDLLASRSGFLCCVEYVLCCVFRSIFILTPLVSSLFGVRF